MIDPLQPALFAVPTGVGGGTVRCMTTCAAKGCVRPAQCCDECRRAIAIGYMGAIARHGDMAEPGESTDCRVCDDGVPVWCGSCWAEQVATYREQLRSGPGPYAQQVYRWDDPRFSGQTALFDLGK